VPNTSSTPIRRDGDKSWHRRSRPVADSSPSRLDVQAQVQEHKNSLCRKHNAAEGETMPGQRRTSVFPPKSGSVSSDSRNRTRSRLRLYIHLLFSSCSGRLPFAVERRLLAYVCTRGPKPTTRLAHGDVKPAEVQSPATEPKPPATFQLPNRL